MKKYFIALYDKDQEIAVTEYCKEDQVMFLISQILGFVSEMNIDVSMFVFHALDGDMRNAY